MIWPKFGKVLLVLAILTAFFIPTLVAVKYVALWQIYGHFVDTVSGVTGINRYLVTVAATLLFIPFLDGN